MDITVDGKLTITASKKTIASIACAFGRELKDFYDGDIQKVDESFEEYMGESFPSEIEIMENKIVIPIVESGALVSEWDVFAKKILINFSEINELNFEGTENSWGSGEFSRFLVKYDGKDLYISDSGYLDKVYFAGEFENYDELLEEMDFDKDKVSRDFFEEHKEENWYKSYDGEIVTEIPLPEPKKVKLK